MIRPFVLTMSMCTMCGSLKAGGGLESGFCGGMPAAFAVQFRLRRPTQGPTQGVVGIAGCGEGGGAARCSRWPAWRCARRFVTGRGWRAPTRTGVRGRRRLRSALRLEISLVLTTVWIYDNVIVFCRHFCGAILSLLLWLLSVWLCVYRVWWCGRCAGPENWWSGEYDGKLFCFVETTVANTWSGSNDMCDEHGFYTVLATIFSSSMESSLVKWSGDNSVWMYDAAYGVFTVTGCAQ